MSQRAQHGDHVYVTPLHTMREERSLWTWYCEHCDRYGSVRFGYSDAVEDGQRHAGYRRAGGE